ncbi:MAG: DsrE family protein [Leptospiraceae bacterium]|nr:DsrE family protein [Leptospiraceae bacterium]MDW7976001.1 DsrE family protein [Leptospiraceae bacterium]
MKVQFLKSIMVLTLVLALPFGLAAQEKTKTDAKKAEMKKVFVSLGTDQGLRTGMALNFSRMSLKNGSPTTLWLNAEGVKLADANAADSEQRMMLKEFISKGGKVYVCPVSSAKLGVTKLIDGAEFSKFEIVYEQIKDPNVIYLSW